MTRRKRPSAMERLDARMVSQRNAKEHCAGRDDDPSAERRQDAPGAGPHGCTGVRGGVASPWLRPLHSIVSACCWMLFVSR